MACGGEGQPFISCLNVARVNVVFVCHGSQVMNTFYVSSAVPYLPDVLTALLDKVESAWIGPASFSSYQSVDVVLIAIAVRDLSTPISLFDARFYTHTGQINAPALPNNATVVSRFFTSVPGRNFTGRSYFVGLPRTVVSGDLCTVTWTDNITQAWANQQGSLQTLGFNHVVASFCYHNHWRTTGCSYVPVEKIATRTVIANLRRRLVGH